MRLLDRAAGAVLHLAERGLDARQDANSTGLSPSSVPPSTVSSPTALATTNSMPSPTQSTATQNPQSSSPLLFFVALGFGVVFTNLWIIVGVKYCFRYNARNRALRNGEDIDIINMEHMPTRPHRRRREKKLMTMDEVNERFPLTKYKAWVSSRAHAGLPTAGGISSVPVSRAASLRDADGAMPASPVGTKHSAYTRPPTAASDHVENDTTITNTSNDAATAPGQETTEKNAAAGTTDMQHVRSTSSTVDHPATVSEADDDDDHIHTAVPPELLATPGDSCAICIDTLEDDDDIRGLSCGHAFHAGCLDPWLTSRRACCPLCKADYFVPKPRPEGEPAEPDRVGRRRTNYIPEPQRGAWVGNIRGTRLMLPGRFMAPPVYGEDYRRRRARHGPRAAAVAIGADPAAAADGAAPPASRWRPRIGNPFRSVTMPSIPLPGRRRGNAGTEAQANPVEHTPSSLEAGTAVR